MRLPAFTRYVLMSIAATVLLGGLAGAQSTKLTIGYGGGQADVGDVADHLGYAMLGADYKVVIQPLGNESAGIAALVAGHLDIANMDLISAIKASQQGLPIRVLIAANVKQEYVFVAKGSVPDLAGLKGTMVAFHAPGSTTEYYANLVVTQLAGLKRDDVKWQAIQGSNNRVAALLSNRIDATVLEWADWLELKDKGDFKVLSTFNDIAPYALATAFITTQSWIDKHPQAAQDFVDAMAAGYAEAYSDKAAFLAEAATLLPEVPAANVAGTYDFYVQIGMFSTPDTLSTENWQKADAYFREIGEYDTAAPYSLVASDLLDSAWSRLP